MPIILIGNKTDSRINSQISKKEGKIFAKKLGAGFFEISAKKDDYDVFEELMKSMAKAIASANTKAKPKEPYLLKKSLEKKLKAIKEAFYEIVRKEGPEKAFTWDEGDDDYKLTNQDNFFGNDLTSKKSYYDCIVI